jgi:hypothetical protein
VEVRFDGETAWLGSFRALEPLHQLQGFTRDHRLAQSRTALPINALAPEQV